MTSPLLTLPGAVAAEEPDTAVAAHYGDPVAEQRALERSAAWVDRGDRGVVRVGGRDRLDLLHNLTTQHLTGLGQEATEALLLDPKGHIQHHLSMVDDGTATWAHVEPGGAAELAAFLDSRRFLAQVEVADRTEERAVLTVAGPDTADAGLRATLAEIGVTRVTEREVDVLVPRGELAAAAERLTGAGVGPAGLWAYDALRIAAHRPRPGIDTDHRAIPHEMGWIGTAVHLDKGCYPGQETVARVHNLGRPPRRLVMLHLDGQAERLPARGAEIVLDGREVGFVGSSARHHELGPIALGLVKRTVPVEAEFAVDGIAAAQEVVVSPDTGKNVTIDLRRR